MFVGGSIQVEDVGWNKSFCVMLLIPALPAYYNFK